MTTIKEIYGEQIYLDDDETTTGKPIITAIACIMMLLGAIILIASAIIYRNAPAPVNVGAIVVFLFAGLMFGGFILNLANRYPAYAVRLTGISYAEDIIILKTTPEQDQIEICKAAKELESKAKEVYDKKTEHARLAAGCKK